MKRSISILFLLGLLAATLPFAQAESISAIQQRMAARISSIDGLKAQGLVGEDNRGYLSARGSLDGAAQTLVTQENADRSAAYAEIARQTGASADAVGKARARKIAAGSAGGIWVQDASGAWNRK